MYIRTKCGWIAKDCEIDKWNRIYFRSNHLTVKSQGDNLSDVLEVKDILIFKDNTSTIYDGFKGVVESFNIFDMIKEIITHEQYMNKAQEVI
jgi:hypothetical protein